MPRITEQTTPAPDLMALLNASTDLQKQTKEEVRRRRQTVKKRRAELKSRERVLRSIEQDRRRLREEESGLGAVEKFEQAINPRARPRAPRRAVAA